MSNLNLKPCGLDANISSAAFLIEGELWQDGSVYLVEDESLGGILLMELNVYEKEGFQELHEIDCFNFDFSDFERIA